MELPGGYTKEQLKKIAHNGYSWGGFIDGIHYFQRTEKDGFYSHVAVEPAQLKNGDLKYFCQHGLTLSDERIKAVEKKYRKQNKY